MSNGSAGVVVQRVGKKKYNDLFDNKVINEAFVLSVTGGSKKRLRLKIAQIFLEHKEFKKCLSGYVLDKAVISFIRFNEKNLFSHVLQDEILRKKLYTNTQVKESFNKALKRVRSRNKWYLKKLLSYEDLRGKVKQLDFITQEMLDQGAVFAPKTENEKELLQAVVARDGKSVKKILDTKDLNEKGINEAFGKTLTGRTKKDMRIKIAHIFLEHQKVKEMLNGRYLDKAVIAFIRIGVRDLFSIVLQDEILRKKLYTSKQTKISFDKTLRKAVKQKKVYLREFLSYSDLKEKVEHLDCIPQEMLDEAEEVSESDIERELCSLVDALNVRDAKQMKQIVQDCFDSIELSDLNYVFIACLYQKYFDGIKTLLSCADFRKCLTEGYVSNISEILNDCLENDDKKYRTIAQKIIDEMCGYKKLKKWLLESVAKSDYQALKKYLKV